MVRMMQSIFAAGLTVVVVLSCAGPLQAAEKGRKGGAVALESLTIAHEGMKGKKPSRVKANKRSTQGQ